MRAALSLAVALALVSCASIPSRTRSGTYEADSGDIWHISAFAKRQPVFPEIDFTVQIDGKDVARGELIYTRQSSIRFSGTYAGEPVTAECSIYRVGNYLTRLCDIYISGELAAKLYV